MNEFVEQFLLECRELVAQATGDLIALEENRDDRERLDSAFRAFHTLKGAAGIVEFAAMGRAFHTAEDVLAALRASETAIHPIVLGECLTCLDVTSRWLDAMEATGEIPVTAEADADQMIARLQLAVDGETSPPSVPADETEDWLMPLRAAAGQDAADARTAVRYRPHADAFFEGHDPLARIANLGGLLAIDLKSSVPAGLEAMNPFTCSLDIRALTRLTQDEVEHVLADLGDQVELRGLAMEAGAQQHPSLMHTLLDAQLLLLQETSSDGFAGRLASAGRSAANALRNAGEPEKALEIEVATNDAVASRTTDALITAIRRVLDGSSTVMQIPAAAAQPIVPRALRVEMERIDALVKLSGELIVTKNAIGHAAGVLRSGANTSDVADTLRQLHAQFDRLTAELQGAVLRIRVLPLRTVFRRFPKLVRESAASVGKTVRLLTDGDATEADATIVDALFEPLLHVLRNAVDHGIENAEQRATAGKSAMGTITLRASRDADSVVIEVIDDGGGIDAARIRSVAQGRGVASAAALEAMSDSEAIDLVFAPGFSTAAAVTGLSGRGVGMDAVRSAVGQLGGQAMLESRPGLGTTVRLTLPFSLMLTRIITVEVAGQSFGLLLDNIIETTIVARDQISSIGAAHALVLRDRTVPLISLAEMLGLVDDTSAKPHARIAVVSADGQIGALEVDRLGQRTDVMLKPMEGLLGQMPGVAGTTLLGDGQVLVVLDVREFFN